MKAARAPETAIDRSCRRLVRRQSLKAAGVSAIPIAGLDLLVNGPLLARTIGHINLAYGLAPEQLARLPAPVRNKVDSLALDVGGYLIGRVLTEGALIAALRGLGLRLTAQQAAKFAPVVGLAASAAMSGWMFKRLCDRHIAQCRQVRAAVPELPPPPDLDIIDMDTATS